MPLLSLLRRLRLPSRSEAELLGFAVFVLLFASWLRRGEAIKTRDTIIAAKPMIEDRIQLVRVEAPVRIIEKIVKSADGSCSIERTTDRGTVTTKTESERKETSVCLPLSAGKVWALGGSLDLRRRDRGAAGVSRSFGDLTLGLGHAWGGDARLGELSAGASLKVF